MFETSRDFKKVFEDSYIFTRRVTCIKNIPVVYIFSFDSSHLTLHRSLFMFGKVTFATTICFGGSGRKNFSQLVL